MLHIERSDENPILVPRADEDWEADGAFNGCPAVGPTGIHFVYRAQSVPRDVHGVNMSRSSIGYAFSKDGVHFTKHRQLIRPTETWEQFGCEDPRITRIGDTYYIFYTALGLYPFRAEGIRVAVAITKNFKTITERHLVTPFNAKAMALFPQKIGGKFAAILTINTDLPPDHIAIALADRIEDYWSPAYWEGWQRSVAANVIPLRRSLFDHLEVGAPPVKTKEGWLLIYSYIENYSNPPATFGIRAALLDLKDPTKVISRMRTPLFTPREEYEQYGAVPNIVFPSGALVKGSKLRMYYGAADTVCAVADTSLPLLLKELLNYRHDAIVLNRYPGNPILAPLETHGWEAKAVFNAAAIELNKEIYIVYRAMSADNTSVFGCAISKDGLTISERLPEPIYTPRAAFERKNVAGGNSGCEDPRLTHIGDRVYITYTAFNGTDPPRIALSSISAADMQARRWQWSEPVLISPAGADDKDCAIFPKKINGKYAVLHRLGVSIWLDYVDSLDGNWEKPLAGSILMNPRSGPNDSMKIGIAGPPIETEYGWLLIYHGVSKKSNHHYHLRAALLDLHDPSKVLVRTAEPILDADAPYERYGIVPNVVFSNGAVVRGDTLFVYYGGADTVLGVATMSLRALLDKLMREQKASEGKSN